MSETIFRLDFSHGTVEEIDEAVPPRGMLATTPDDAPEPLPSRTGYILAALGTPPDDEEEG